MSFDVKGKHVGSSRHQATLAATIGAFEEAGHDVRRVEQTGRPLPDALVSPGVSGMIRTGDGDASEDVFTGKELAIEAETETTSKPVQLLLGLASAINNDQQCAFVVPAEERDDDLNADVDHTWRAKQALTAIRGRSIDNPSITESTDDHIGIAQYSEEGVQRYYNSKRDLRVDGGVAVRPSESSPGMWFRTTEGHIVYRLGRSPGGDDTDDQIRFTDHNTLEDGDAERVSAVRKRDGDEWCVIEADGTETRYRSREQVQAEWDAVPKPFIPEIGFSRPPTERDYVILIADPEAADRDEPVLQRYNPAADDLDPIRL